MTRSILDESTLLDMAQVESVDPITGKINPDTGLRWLEDSLTHESPYTVRRAITRVRHHIDCVSPRFELTCVYGSGGWDRWYVWSNGDVTFSSHHGFPKALDKARELGFEIK